MTAEKLIRLLLELDQQVVSPRPSDFGLAARLVKRMAYACLGDYIDSDKLGKFWEVDATAVDLPVPRDLHQPVLDEIQAKG